VAQGFYAHAQEGARRGAVALARAWPELVAGRVGAGARRPQDRYEREKAVEGEEKATGGRRKRMGSTPPRAILFIGGSTESICCGSFHRTMRLNGSIPRSFRED
jgi:hypothetical protein